MSKIVLSLQIIMKLVCHHKWWKQPRYWHNWLFILFILGWLEHKQKKMPFPIESQMGTNHLSEEAENLKEDGWSCSLIIRLPVRMPQPVSSIQQSTYRGIHAVPTLCFPRRQMQGASTLYPHCAFQGDGCRGQSRHTHNALLSEEMKIFVKKGMLVDFI